MISLKGVTQILFHGTNDHSNELVWIYWVTIKSILPWKYKVECRIERINEFEGYLIILTHVSHFWDFTTC